MVAAMLALLSAAGVQRNPVCTAPTRTGASEALTMRLRLLVEVRSADGRPVPYVDVRFLDTAPPPSARGMGVRVGSTDETGTLNTVVVHTWPDYFRNDRRSDVGTFDIIVAEQVTHAAVECLPRKGDESLLTVRVVAESETIIISSQESRQRGEPPNKRMQLTKLRAAPVRQAEVPPCAPAAGTDGGTASQLIRSVRRTWRV